MQNESERKIRVGQIWRNKEKNYTIKVIAKIKKDVWQVSAHGRGSTTHGMTEHSFHFYELVDQNDDNKIPEEELMIVLTDKVRDIYNKKININEFFSIYDLCNMVIENNDDNFDETKIVHTVSAFVHHLVADMLIKKHTDKKKNSKSKKIFQKIENSIVTNKERKFLSDIKVNEKHFIKVFNSIETGQKFDSSGIYNLILDETGCNELDSDKKQIIRSRIYSYISKYVKKGYIDKEGQRFSTLTKIKDIDNGFVLNSSSEDVKTKAPVEDVKVEAQIKETKTPEQPPEDIKTQAPEKQPPEKQPPVYSHDLRNEKEIKEKLDILNEKFKNVELKDLVETATIYFNILIEKDLLHKSVVSKLDLEIIDLKQNQEELIIKVSERNKTINSLTTMIRLLNKEILKFDKDLEFQLEENEKFKLKNTDLQNRIVQLEHKIKEVVPEETDAWQSIKIHEAINMN